MTSQARIDANRRNAQLSTGPRTPEGKAVVAGNAIKHGLSGRHVILQDEDPHAFDRLQDGLTVDHRPRTATEEILVRRMAQAEWRSQRIIRRQTTLLNADPSHEQSELILLNRYEGTASREFFRSLDHLERYHIDRRRMPHTNPQTIANSLIDDLTKTLEQTLAATAQTNPLSACETNPIPAAAAQPQPTAQSTPQPTTNPEKEPRPEGSGCPVPPTTPANKTNPIPDNPNIDNDIDALLATLLAAAPAKPVPPPAPVDSAIQDLRRIAQQLRADHSTPTGNPNVAAGMDALLAALLPQPAPCETKPTSAGAPHSSTT